MIVCDRLSQSLNVLCRGPRGDVCVGPAGVGLAAPFGPVGK